MKTLKILIVLFLVGTFTAFAQNSDVDLNKSTVKWTGNKIGGSHNGDIKVKSGSFVLDAGNIVSGNVVIDMNTITNADLTDETYNQKLVGHLKSDDFFGVEKFPTASFKVTKASKFKNGKAKLTGTLTIKGKSDKITFEITKKGDTYSTQLKVDRSKFDVRYGSKSFFNNLADKAIDDIFILDIQLVFNEQTKTDNNS
ncbi:MAG: hypothetical protein A2X64_10315 [Ignavibacteria bacterium GWF2_33_9]|nr:MAG: hypothetical protein A2X64_10315 [Ignavibacteria bacterium GWF2_33_9]